MDYASFLIRKNRIEKDWSQEGLCKGICTASYLSKIEKGKAAPSEEVLQLLFKRLGIRWNGKECGCSGELIEIIYDLLFSEKSDILHSKLESEEWKRYENSPWGVDYLLIHRLFYLGSPLDKDLEHLMDARQLALQRILQGRCDEAVRVYPCSFTCWRAGYAYYERGNSAQAVEFMQRANTLATEEGRAEIMLNARMVMGACYANIQDFESMERHYIVARRLAYSLGAKDDLEIIDYNIAATCIEVGRYEQAMKYFEKKRDSNSRIVLHKLAICCEKMGRKEEALEALDRAETLPDNSPEKVESAMCQTVRLRLTQHSYLDSQEYGDSLQRCFSLCSRNKPVGYCLFHIPWMVEWYEHHRQYKEVVSLLYKFPEFKKNIGLNS